MGGRGGVRGEEGGLAVEEEWYAGISGIGGGELPWNS